MIVETTLYYAKPGLAEAVVDRRKAGCDLRTQLGLEPGTIWQRVGEQGPDVRWECRFEDEAAFQRDLAARDQSPEFALQRDAMGALLDRFERHVQRLLEP